MAGLRNQGAHLWTRTKQNLKVVHATFHANIDIYNQQPDFKMCIQTSCDIKSVSAQFEIGPGTANATLVGVQRSQHFIQSKGFFHEIKLKRQKIHSQDQHNTGSFKLLVLKNKDGKG